MEDLTQRCKLVCSIKLRPLDAAPVLEEAAPVLEEAPPGAFQRVQPSLPFTYTFTLAVVGFHLSWLIGNTGSLQPPAAPGFRSLTWHGEQWFHFQ